MVADKSLGDDSLAAVNPALEGHEQEAARMLAEYLARADTAARIEQLEE